MLAFSSYVLENFWNIWGACFPVIYPMKIYASKKDASVLCLHFEKKNRFLVAFLLSYI